MAFQKILALAFALSAATAQADNCEKVDASYKLKATLTGVYCGSSSMACSATDGCDCDTCCEAKPHTCANPVSIHTSGTVSSANGCDAAQYIDEAKAAVAVKVDHSDFKANCCTAKKTCDITCSAGHKDIAAKATTKCAGGTCSEQECCETDPLTCLGAISGAIGASTYCDATQYFDGAKAATAVKADFTDFKANCCAAQKVCDTTCPAGHKDKTSKATIKCAGAECGASECCDPDATKCAAFSAASGKGCDATTEYKDEAKNGNVVKTDSSDYKTQCCSKKATCAAFKDHVLASTSSGAVKPQMSATALLLAAAGVLALVK